MTDEAQEESIDKALEVIKKNPFLRNEIEICILKSVNKGIREDKVFGEKFVRVFIDNLKENKEFWEILIKEMNNERNDANKTPEEKNCVY